MVVADLRLSLKLKKLSINLLGFFYFVIDNDVLKVVILDEIYYKVYSKSNKVREGFLDSDFWCDFN